MKVIDLATHTSGLTYGFMMRTAVDAAYRRLKVADRQTPGGLHAMVEQLAQVPLDFFGEIMDMFGASRRHGLADGDSWHVQKVLLDCLESRWDEPGEGIWEIRGGPQHFVHSKVMAWVAYDRAWRTAHHNERQKRHWKKIADDIHADICGKGVDAQGGFFVQHYGSECVDASLLQLPLVGFLPPDDQRIVKTVEEIERSPKVQEVYTTRV